MSWIKRVTIFIGFIIVFAFAYSANEVPVHKIQIEKQNPSFSTNSTHSSVFIEPQLNHTFVSTQKTLDFSVVKYFKNYLVTIPDLKINTQRDIYINQDINRCEMVSLLLFPFHFFW